MAEKSKPKGEKPTLPKAKTKIFSEGQIKDKPIIDKAKVQPPPPTKPKN